MTVHHGSSVASSRVRVTAVLHGVGRMVATVLAVIAVVVPGYWFVRASTVHHPRQVSVRPVTLPADVRAMAAAFPSYRHAVPVINYHDIAGRGGRYTITPTEFTRHMAALKAAGFETVSLADVYAVVTGEAVDLPDKPLLITFDDGPSSNWRVADPVLQRYGFTAVAFIVTGAIGDETRPSYYLSWDQLRAMEESGRWEIGAHTHVGHRSVDVGGGQSGPWLTNLVHDGGRSEDLRDWRRRVSRDLTHNKELLSTEVGAPAVEVFAYPFSAAGSSTNHEQLPDLVRSVIAAHFDLAFAGREETPWAASKHSDRRRLPRLSIRNDVDAAHLLEKLRRATPAAPSGDLHELRLQSSAGQCVVRNRARLVVRGDAYVRCVPAINPNAWKDYTLTATVQDAGSRNTALLAVRNIGEERVEVAYGEDRVVIRQQRPDGWRELGTMTYEMPPDGELQTSLRVDRDVLRVDVEGAERSWVLDDMPRAGGVTFGKASQGPERMRFAKVNVTE